MAKTGNVDKNTSIYLNGQNMKDYQEAKYLSKKALHIMFDGYITKISVDTPVELHCENLAYSLKQITCPKIDIKGNDTVNQIFGEDGLNLLKGTGLSLHPILKEQKYDLGTINLVQDLTIADVLTKWSQYGIHTFVTEYDGNPVLAIGRSYFSNANSDSIVNMSGGSSVPVDILFDYHVAENNLSLQSTNKDFLAVEAEGLESSNKFYHVTIIKNSKYDPNIPSSSKYRILNETKLSKKAIKLGLKPLSGSSEKINMDLYTVIPYHSRKIPVTKDELYDEAIKYMESYDMNGIEGSLTLFGDLHLKSGMKVRLVDKSYPGKNGIYLVDNVETTFGVDGYRQTIKLPYCIEREKKD